MVSLNWINERLGLGIFAQREYKRGEYVASAYDWDREGSPEEHAALPAGATMDGKYTIQCPAMHASIHKEWCLWPSPRLVDRLWRNAVPSVIFVNHSSTPNVRWSYIWDADGKPSGARMKCTRPIAVGEQVLIDYGPGYWAPGEVPDETVYCLARHGGEWRIMEVLEESEDEKAEEKEEIVDGEATVMPPIHNDWEDQEEKEDPDATESDSETETEEEEEDEDEEEEEEGSDNDWAWLQTQDDPLYGTPSLSLSLSPQLIRIAPLVEAVNARGNAP